MHRRRQAAMHILFLIAELSALEEGEIKHFLPAATVSYFRRRFTIVLIASSGFV